MTASVAVLATDPAARASWAAACQVTDGLEAWLAAHRALAYVLAPLVMAAVAILQVPERDPGRSQRDVVRAGRRGGGDQGRGDGGRGRHLRARPAVRPPARRAGAPRSGPRPGRPARGRGRGSGPARAPARPGGRVHRAQLGGGPGRRAAAGVPVDDRGRDPAGRDRVHAVGLGRRGALPRPAAGHPRGRRGGRHRDRARHDGPAVGADGAWS